MSRRRIGQEKFGFAVDRGQHSSLDELARLVDWAPIDQALCVISCSAKGEPAWPPMGPVQGDAAVDLVRSFGRQARRGAGRQGVNGGVKTGHAALGGRFTWLNSQWKLCA
jgi:hypothetical protein